MLLSTLKVQKGLTVLGFDPGPIDGVFGAQTERALRTWGRNGNLAFTRGADGRTVDITPVALANQLVGLAANYDRHVTTARIPGYVPAEPERRPDVVVSDRPHVIDASGGGAIVPEATLELPFWRTANPWAWVAVLVPTSLTLALASWFFMPKRRRRRG